MLNIDINFWIEHNFPRLQKIQQSLPRPIFLLRGIKPKTKAL